MSFETPPNDIVGQEGEGAFHVGNVTEYPEGIPVDNAPEVVDADHGPVIGSVKKEPIRAPQTFGKTVARYRGNMAAKKPKGEPYTNADGRTRYINGRPANFPPL